MGRKKLVWTLMAISVLSLGATKGAFAVMSTIDRFDGVCGQLDGFPGLLQQTGVLTTGNCKALLPGRECRDHLCLVNGHRGKCETLEVRNKYFCRCVPYHVSR